jgi:hypothetical protein
VDQIETTNNIAYKNSACEAVTKEVRKMTNKTGDYEVGETLVCRKYLKISGNRFPVNFEYSSEAVNKESLQVGMIGSDFKFTLKLDVVKKQVIHGYCRTCHSFQGSSIDDKITILDWNFFFVNRKWVYTAVPRATELKKVVFFAGSSTTGTSGNQFEETILNNHLDTKVRNYIRQDTDHGRPITGNFVTTDWLKGQFGKVCSDCGDCFRFDIKGRKVESNLTADHIDCGECHHLNNIVPLCVTCNQRKSCW